MNTIINVVIWWAGALVVLAALLTATIALVYGLTVWADKATTKTLYLMRLTTVRYWYRRMEDEGLLVCSKEYRRIVAERKAATIAEFKLAEHDSNSNIKENT